MYFLTLKIWWIKWRVKSPILLSQFIFFFKWTGFICVVTKNQLILTSTIPPPQFSNWRPFMLSVLIFKPKLPYPLLLLRKRTPNRQFLQFLRQEQQHSILFNVQPADGQIWPNKHRRERKSRTRPTSYFHAICNFRTMRPLHNGGFVYCPGRKKLFVLILKVVCVAGGVWNYWWYVCGAATGLVWNWRFNGRWIGSGLSFFLAKRSN